MRHILMSFAMSLIVLSACSQQQAAETVDNSGKYFGRNGWTENGQPIPRYSANNPAQQSQDMAFKYNSGQPQQYGVDAPVESMQVKDLPPPSGSSATPVQSSSNYSAPISASNVPPAPFSQAKPDAAPILKSIPSTAPQTPPQASLPLLPAIASTPKVNDVTSRPIVSDSSVDSGEPPMLQWPVAGNIISRFGPKTDGLSNDGVNIEAAEGSPIWASAGGEVAYVGSDLNGYGNLLILRHADGWMSSYAHAKEFLLTKGNIVKQGDLLGYVGSSGSVKSPQLHFSLRDGKIPIDPESVVNKESEVANKR